MGFLSFVFFKSYFYFIVYWALSLLGKIEKDSFELNSNYTSTSNSNNSLDNNITINSSNIFIFSSSSSNDTFTTVDNGGEVDLLYLICLNIADLSAGLLVAYTYIRMNYFKEKKEKKVKKTKIKGYELIYNDPSKKENKYILILLISVLDFLGRCKEIFFFLFVNTERLTVLQTSWLLSIDILSRVIFCYIILKTKLYKHHWISLALCCIGFFIMFCFSLLSDGSYEGKYWLYLLFILISNILFGLEDTINKILLTNKFLLPHFLMFWRGLFCFVIIFIFTIILVSTEIIDVGYYKYLYDKEDFWKEILSKLFYIIINFFKVFCIFKTIYIFTPTHVGFLNVINVITELIKYIIENKDINILYFIFDIICLIVILVGTLIFNEMIILNFLGLNENTKIGKMKKEALDGVELNSTTIIFNENEGDNEEEEVHLNDLNQEENEEKEENEDDNK